MRFLYLLASAVFVSVLSGCGDQKRENDGGRDGPLIVVAVNGPLQYFAQRIGGEHVTATCDCPQEISPALWEPDENALDEFYSADLILLNGGGYAKWTVTTSLPDSSLVNTGRAFREDWLTMSEAVRHQHGPDGEHSHEATIGEFWLAPEFAILQATRIEQALAKNDPENKDEFTAGLAELKKDLQELHSEMQTAIGSDTQLLAAEPAFEYIAHSTGRELTRLTWPNVNEPGDEELAEFRDKLLADKPRLFMLSVPPSEKLAEQLELAGVATVVFDICETTTDEPYLTRMQANVARLKAAMAAE